ncbi:MAG: ferritin-like domain-containing protein [Actinomycetia bacterium]|nr:ferritin-like domain-containing protein [Actinomycetes bacterium]MCH9799949.1 ferritin-like domain-containing protein [Actinomycetes bacterium]
MSEGTWRTIAEGEAAAVYAYGILIPRLPSGERPTARDALIFHSRQRDAAIAELAAMGVAIELPIVFEIPFAIKTADDAARLAAIVENRLVNIYCTVAAVFSGDQRRDLVATARADSARAVFWGQRPEAFPGTTDPVMSPIGKDDQPPQPQGEESPDTSPTDPPPVTEQPAPESPAPAPTGTGGDGAAIVN